MKNKLVRAFTFGLIGSFGILTGAGLALAATTISTDIQTGGNLSVTGTANIGDALSEFNSLTQSYAGDSADPSVLSGVNGFRRDDSDGGSFGAIQGVLGIAEVTTQLSEPTGGYFVGSSIGFDGSSNETFGSQGTALVSPNVGQTLSDGVGYASYSEKDGAGTVTYLMGFKASGNSINAGTVHNNFGFYSSSQAGIGDTLNAAYAAGDQGTGVNDYAIYLAGGKSYFGGKTGVGTSSPIANFQVANSNATTTVEFGSANESKGSCLKLYRTDGSAIYAYVAAGATTFTLTTTACANVSNF